MKKSALVLTILFFIFSINSFSQTNKGNYELSLSGTFGSYSESVSSSSYSSDGESITYIVLNFRPGFFVINSLELEPEILLTSMESTEPAYNLSANVSYNFDIKDSNVKPFILAGYGIGNSFPILNTIFIRSSDKVDISNLNLGAGIKIFVSSQAAFKIEYRYQRFSYSRDLSSYYYYGGSSVDYKLNSHRVLFGFSIFL